MRSWLLFFALIVGVSSQNVQLNKKIFCEVLQRCPNADELKLILDTYVKSGYSCREVFRVALKLNSEYFNKNLAATHPAQTTSKLYSSLLNRAPDALGLFHWNNQLLPRGGGWPAIIDGLVNSPEFKNKIHGNLITCQCP